MFTWILFVTCINILSFSYFKVKGVQKIIKMTVAAAVINWVLYYVYTSIVDYMLLDLQFSPWIVAFILFSIATLLTMTVHAWMVRRENLVGPVAQKNGWQCEFCGSQEKERVRKRLGNNWQPWICAKCGAEIVACESVV